VRSKKEIQLLNALEAAACAQGFDLVDLEFTGSGRNALLRVYVDKAEGLTLDAVAGANAWISEVLEKLDPYRGSYTLEVSSPGIDRPLRTLAHFVRALGEEAIIVMESSWVPSAQTAPENKQRYKYTGLITDVDEQKQLITLSVDGAPCPLEFIHIKKARLKGHLDFEGRKDS
jgi:ribosome maturation factor RimP